MFLDLRFLLTLLGWDARQSPPGLASGPWPIQAGLKTEE